MSNLNYYAMAKKEAFQLVCRNNHLCLDRLYGDIYIPFIEGTALFSHCVKGGVFFIVRTSKSNHPDLYTAAYLSYEQNKFVWKQDAIEEYDLDYHECLRFKVLGASTWTVYQKPVYPIGVGSERSLGYRASKEFFYRVLADGNMDVTFLASVKGELEYIALRCNKFVATSTHLAFLTLDGYWIVYNEKRHRQNAAELSLNLKGGTEVLFEGGIVKKECFDESEDKIWELERAHNMMEVLYISK